MSSTTQQRRKRALANEAGMALTPRDEEAIRAVFDRLPPGWAAFVSCWEEGFAIRLESEWGWAESEDIEGKRFIADAVDAFFGRVFRPRRCMTSRMQLPEAERGR